MLTHFKVNNKNRAPFSSSFVATFEDVFVSWASTEKPLKPYNIKGE